MNIENLLKYQKLDEELYKVEQKLTKSENRRKANELSAIAKKAQTRSVELESEASKTISELEEIKKKYDITKQHMDEMLATKVEDMNQAELEKLSALKNKIASNLVILEKMLQKSAESINHILSDFNKAKKTFDEARTQFADCKQKIDEESKALEPEKARLVKELEKLEKDVDATLLAEYKKKRNDNIFPVVVPLESGNFCGRCRMELPKVAISRIKEKGVITCEHCKRLIYQK